MSSLSSFNCLWLQRKQSLIQTIICYIIIKCFTILLLVARIGLRELLRIKNIFTILICYSIMIATVLIVFVCFTLLLRIVISFNLCSIAALFGFCVATETLVLYLQNHVFVRYAHCLFAEDRKVLMHVVLTLARLVRYLVWLLDHAIIRTVLWYVVAK
jgi:hypothetical protein